MRKIAAVILSAMIFLTGCTPLAYVQYRLVVHAIGVDLGEDGGLKVAYQVFAPDKSSGSSGPTDASGSNVTTVVTAGKTLYEAEENLELQMGRKAFFGNIELIVIGKDLINSKLSELISYFRDSADVYLGVDVVFSTSTAVETLSVKLKQGNASSQVLREAVEATAEDSATVSAKIIEINNALSERSGSLVMPIVTVASGKPGGEESSLSNTIIGVFSSMLIKDDYPIAVFDRECAKGVRLLNGSAETMNFNVTLEDLIAAVRIENIKIDRKIRISQSGYPVVRVEISGELTVKENPNAMLLEVIRREAQQEMMSLCDMAYGTVLLENGADVFDIGKMLRKYEPDYYDYTASAFDEIVKNTLFEVEITLKTC
ncbi:MAG: hypothetical protein IJ424_06585 [Oscillospiraceae bacterium]|nr:hypothetical protein [Oscillospiraceae bacterium]